MAEERKEPNAGDDPEKWGLSNNDVSSDVTPEIARLTDFTGYYTFADDDGEREEAEYRDIVAEIIGDGPEEVVSLDAIKQSILSLKPYVQTRLQESRHVVQVLEIYPTGETGYKTSMSLAKLLQFVRKLVEKIGGGVAATSAPSSSGKNGGESILTGWFAGLSRGITIAHAQSVHIRLSSSASAFSSSVTTRRAASRAARALRTHLPVTRTAQPRRLTPCDRTSSTNRILPAATGTLGVAGKAA
jgi:hypothetical protein